MPGGNGGGTAGGSDAAASPDAKRARESITFTRSLNAKNPISPVGYRAHQRNDDDICSL